MSRPIGLQKKPEGLFSPRVQSRETRKSEIGFERRQSSTERERGVLILIQRDNRIREGERKIERERIEMRESQREEERDR
jgi:hypothetical protein